MHDLRRNRKIMAITASQQWHTRAQWQCIMLEFLTIAAALGVGDLGTDCQRAEARVNPYAKACRIDADEVLASTCKEGKPCRRIPRVEKCSIPWTSRSIPKSGVSHCNANVTPLQGAIRFLISQAFIYFAVCKAAAWAAQ